MEAIVWYAPKLKEISVKELLKKVSIKASSYETDDCYGGNILQGGAGNPGASIPPGDWMAYCIEFGPLGGCDNWAACAENSVPILSSNNDSTI